MIHADNDFAMPAAATAMVQRKELNFTGVLETRATFRF